MVDGWRMETEIIRRVVVGTCGAADARGAAHKVALTKFQIC